MPSISPPRGPLLVLLTLIVAVFVLRAFLSVPPDGSAGVGRFVSRPQISMLTFNLWFYAEKMRERMQALGQIIHELQPDVLTFQEVTPDNFALLKEQHWFSRYYLIPADDFGKQGRSSLVILSAFLVDKWFIYTFKNPPPNRKLVIAEAKAAALSKSMKFVVGTAHLAHAGYNTRLRELQLNESLTLLSVYDNVCLMGDMNIEHKVDGDIILPWAWIDAWLFIPGNTNSNGYTWDRSKTSFALARERSVNATSYQARLDRVFCKLSDLKVKEIRIVGDKLSKSGVIPSDHFGLFTVIQPSVKTGSQKHNEISKTEKFVYFKRPLNWEKLVQQELSRLRQ